MTKKKKIDIMNYNDFEAYHLNLFDKCISYLDKTQETYLENKDVEEARIIVQEISLFILSNYDDNIAEHMLTQLGGKLDSFRIN